MYEATRLEYKSRWLHYAGMDGDGALLFAASHELTHYAKDWSPAGYKRMTNFLFENYGESGVSVDDRITAELEYQKTQERNQGKSTEELYDIATEEVVAKSMESMLSDGNLSEKLAKLKDTDYSTWQMLKDWISQLAQRIKDAYKGLRPDSKEGRMVAQMKDSIDAIAQMFAEALDDASRNEQAARERGEGKAEKNTTREGDVKYMIRKKTYSSDEMSDNARSVLKMDVVESIPSSALEKTGKKPSQIFSEKFAKWGNNIYTEEFGDVKAENSSVKSDVRHGITAEKIASIDAIPEVLKKGKVIHAVMKTGTDVERIVVCAPIKIGETKYYMGVMLQRDSANQRLYIHNVVLDSDIKIETTDASQADLVTTGALDEDSHLYMTIIMRRLLSVNNQEEKNNAHNTTTDSKGRELSEGQLEYFKDSKARDENGALKVMYHGTSNGGHNIFDPYGKAKYGLFGLGTYFTDNKSVAESYTKKGKGSNPQVYEAYLNIINPIDMDAVADSGEWNAAFPDAHFPYSGTNEEFYRAMEEYFRDEEYVRWEAEEAAMEGIMSMGYDGITHIGGGRFNKADNTRHRVYIAFESEQIKRTDNLNPTTNPDIQYQQRQQRSEREVRALERENAKLREDLEDTRELLALQGKVTGGTKVTKSSRNRMADILMKQNNAKGDSGALAELLDDVYRYIATGHELTMDGVYEAAEPAAQYIMDHLKREQDGYAKEVLAQMKGTHINLDAAQLQEAASLYGSMRNFFE